MGFYGCIPRFIKKHAGWILTALGLGGMTGTVILTAKAAPKVADEISEEVIVRWYKNRSDGIKEHLYADNELYDYCPLPDLTFSEKFEIAAPHYLPAFLTGIATAACFVGAQIINGRQQAALIAAYGLLAQEFGQYREVIKTEYGEEVNKKALAIAQMERARLEAELIKMRQEHGPFLYTIATLPGVIFESTPKRMTEVFYHCNRNLMQGGDVSEAILYEMIGLPKEVWNWNALDYGWDEYENEITWGSSIGHFKVELIGEKNGMPLYLIDFWIPPYKLGLDYGNGDSSCDNHDQDYNPDAAKNWAMIAGANQITKVDEPELYIQEPW